MEAKVIKKEPVDKDPNTIEIIENLRSSVKEELFSNEETIESDPLACDFTVNYNETLVVRKRSYHLILNLSKTFDCFTVMG